MLRLATITQKSRARDMGTISFRVSDAGTAYPFPNAPTATVSSANVPIHKIVRTV
jgi:hypothetical protein